VERTETDEPALDAVSKIVVPRKRYRGFEFPLSLQKAKNGMLRPGPGGRVLASLGRVREQLDGRLDNNKRNETDGRALNNRMLSPAAPSVNIHSIDAESRRPILEL